MRGMAFVSAIDLEGRRRREDMGDLDALAASIERYGLLHPVVIDSCGRLVAGGRRLAAVELLGWARVPVRELGDLTDAELREIELEENLQRKDLTQEERDRTLVALAETAAEADTESYVRPSDASPGAPEQPGSLRRVADRIGVPKSSIADARDHVEAIDRYPELRQAAAIGASRKDVVTIARNLDKLDQPDRETALAKVEERDIDTIGDLAEKPPMPPAGVGDQPSAAVVWHRLMQKIAVLVGGINRAGGLDRLTEEWTEAERREMAARADNAIEVLAEIRDGLRRKTRNAA